MWSLNLEATGRPGNTFLVEHEPEYTKKEAKFQFTRRIHLTGKFIVFLVQISTSR